MSDKNTVVKLLLLSLCAVFLGAQQSPRELFERARLLDENGQDLARAIELYKRVADEAKDQPALAARALIQMGRCHERLGLREARTVYQRVIDQFPGQAEEVKIAKERLAALAVAASKDQPRFRKIEMAAKIPDVSYSALSPDGETLAFFRDRALWAVPLRSRSGSDLAGVPVQLTGAVLAHSTIAHILSWSRDGKWIVVRNIGTEGGISLVPASGGEPRRIPVRPCCQFINMVDLAPSLSPDSKWIAYSAWSEKPADVSVYLAPVEGGVSRRVTGSLTGGPVHSPDGSEIAYVEFTERSDRPGRYLPARIWVLQPGGGKPALAAEFPAGRRYQLHRLVWSPKGDMLAFTAASVEDSAIWIVPVSQERGGAVEPTKFPLPRSADEHLLAGWDTQDRIGLLTRNAAQARIYTVPAKGGLAAQLTPKTAYLPDWTPDSRRIYFAGTHHGSPIGIESIPAQGGEVTRTSVEAEYVGLGYPSGGYSVSPDGTKVVFFGAVGKKAQPEAGVFTVPAQGGRPTQLTSSAGDERPCWSPDGKSVAFLRRGEGTKGVTVNVVPAGGGTPRELAHNVAPFTIAWSPDGRYIAYSPQEDAIGLLPVDGGQARVVLGGLKRHRWTGLAWSSDGSELAYVSAGRIWRVSRDGGQPTEVRAGLDGVDPTFISWSPDGQTLAFEGQTGGDWELSLMEDFLHLVKR